MKWQRHWPAWKPSGKSLKPATVAGKRWSQQADFTWLAAMAVGCAEQSEAHHFAIDALRPSAHPTEVPTTVGALRKREQDIRRNRGCDPLLHCYCDYQHGGTQCCERLNR